MHDLDRSDLVFEASEDGELDGEAADHDGEGVFDEIEQTELATELLGVTDDHELDQFLGNLLGKVRHRLSGALKGQLGSWLKGAIKTALPTLAGAAGTVLGGPVGALVAKQGAGALGSLLGLELEGLSPEDQELESAKQLIRMAGSAIQAAANAGGGSPAAIARDAVAAAARRYAPGLVRGHGHRAQSGRWYRRGNKIVIVGV
jgi:hypothetical protein